MAMNYHTVYVWMKRDDIENHPIVDDAKGYLWLKDSVMAWCNDNTVPYVYWSDELGTKLIFFSDEDLALFTLTWL